MLAVSWLGSPDQAVYRPMQRGSGSMALAEPDNRARYRLAFRRPAGQYILQHGRGVAGRKAAHVHNPLPCVLFIHRDAGGMIDPGRFPNKSRISSIRSALSSNSPFLTRSSAVSGLMTALTSSF